ncbi:clock-controlled protein-like protein 8 [Byssothecium circinans]|uniref:Clock-controlled protein-like protein 8 n=1 Tax=Byssothecium circinans TaxID=147558 RepID=A0A6A5UE04_9PLEO|nr:clock-controlled protein-like protein 8 [Byssothecium circinans]
MQQEDERQRQQPAQSHPPAYTQHDPQSLNLPSVPTHTLPSLRSLDLPDVSHHHYHVQRGSVELSPRATTTQWASVAPLTFPRVPEGEVGSPMDTCSVISGCDDRLREMSVSVDDPDVRLAAEALSGLGNPDFVRSPTSRSLTLSARSPTATEPEPLLNLLTSAHPWLGGSINGSISAYNTTKTYSPRILKYGAELIERNIGSPVVNTVSSVGRRTGVEQNLRRYLGEAHRRPSDLEQGDTQVEGRKRQRISSPAGTDAMDIEESTVSSRTRGDSQSSLAESLPAYDDHRSPKYEETAVVVVDPATGKEEQPSSSTQDRRVNWSTQLIMTTSGLGVALSDASLKSLKICLSVLRSATRHIDSVMRALKQLMEEYEIALRNNRQSNGEATHNEKASVDITMTDSTGDAEKDEQVRRLASRMKSLSTDIWNTLQTVVHHVSRYTGGALPQNASQVVRTQLLSVPQRWQLASRSAAAERQGEEVRGANRMLNFAKEGLDMIGQITAVVDGTVQSAENWLARIGRRPAQQQESGEPSGGMWGKMEFRVRVCMSSGGCGDAGVID